MVLKCLFFCGKTFWGNNRSPKVSSAFCIEYRPEIGCRSVNSRYFESLFFYLLNSLSIQNINVCIKMQTFKKYGYTWTYVGTYMWLFYVLSLLVYFIRSVLNQSYYKWNRKSNVIEVRRGKSPQVILCKKMLVYINM